MSDHEQFADEREAEADKLAQAGDDLEQKIEAAKDAEEEMYKDPVIHEPEGDSDD